MPRRSNSAAQLEKQAEMFAALGDRTRLSLVTKLNNGRPQSIAELTEGTAITRQAVTRHLTVLENVGLVTKVKEGREVLYELDPRPLRSMQECLQIIASQWDETLHHLKKFLEE